MRQAQGEVWKEEEELLNLQFLDLLGDRGGEMLSNASQARISKLGRLYYCSSNTISHYQIGTFIVSVCFQEWINDQIQKFDVDFDLVMITKYFDESLVLLSHLLCLPLHNMAGLPKKIMSGGYAQVQKETSGQKLFDLNCSSRVKIATLLHSLLTKNGHKQ